MKKISKIILIFLIFNLTFCSIISMAAADSTDEAEENEDQILEEPQINSEGAYLMENTSGKILYEKNSDEKLYPASTTKIMTAILIIENCNLTDTTTVSQKALNLVPSGYTNAGLVAGEELTIEDLLYALMLASANEAANVLAEYLSGSIEDFAVLMNEKAEEIGCTNTHFTNANGMHDENHYTTAKDLCLIANYCIQNETFKTIIKTLKYTLPATNEYPEEDRKLTNTNSLINARSDYYYKYAIGGKTGFTTEAGYCLVCFAERAGALCTCVLLNADSSDNRFEDAKNLLTYTFDNYSNKVIVSSNTVVGDIDIDNATSKTKNVEIATYESVSDFVPNDFDENLDYKISLNEDLSAPIYAGDQVGVAIYSLDNKEYSIPLIAKTSAYKAHNYAIYFVIAGVVLLIVSVILIVPRRGKR